ncbi:OLC1v1029078C1 [Oldenlandia corymbosa var. corymbosa]|uniref:GATA transcription factor n=1 Tax=Oldenlandia corymbosa var. corymbosa TaxID=529605 RepID=A0AAV1CEZ0_OLDCO|nr:OLC1v1029078C1 [Oldenlandia corymbosa var. corymbosa]
METPEFYQGGYYNAQFTPEKRLSVDAKNGDHFAVDDLLDFPNDDGIGGGDGSSAFDMNAAGSTDSSNNNNVVDNSCNSSFSGSTEPHFTGGGGEMGGSGRNFADGQFSSELCVPYDDLAELEWLSNFVEDSFSSDDLQRLNLYSGMKPVVHAHTNEESETHEYPQPEPNRATSNPMFRPEMMSVPAKARSKRSRAAPCNWTSRLLMVSPTPATAAAPPPINNNGTITATATAMSSSSESEIGPITGKKTVKPATPKKKEGNFDHHNSNSAANNNHHHNSNSEGRKCLHCATDKTPQWRTGPMGPKTLCNACGVRYKSGRLVPEYRPAASPTFVLTKHSNSHRKVLELRRQKEMMRAQQHHQQFLHHHQNMMFDVSSNGDDYLIHQHVGPDFRQLI